MFSEPENFRPSTPPPQVLRVPYDFSGSSSTMTLESASDVQSASIHASAYAKDDDLRIHLLGAHPLWGHHLWNASLDISRYLQRHASSLLHGGKSVLELGAAAGVPSIVCAREGAECVVATDYPDQPLIDVLIKNLETNVHTKPGHKAVAEAYLWGADPSPLKAHLAPEKREHGFDLLKEAAVEDVRVGLLDPESWLLPEEVCPYPGDTEQQMLSGYRQAVGRVSGLGVEVVEDLQLALPWDKFKTEADKSLFYQTSSKWFA